MNMMANTQSQEWNASTLMFTNGYTQMAALKTDIWEWTETNGLSFLKVYNP